MTFYGVNDTDIATESSQDFFTAMYTSMSGLCRGIVTEETEPIISVSNLAVISARILKFAGIGQNTMSISCDNCSDIISNAASVSDF